MRQVLAALSGGMEAPEEMARQVYRGLEERAIRIGAMLIARLEKLIEEARVKNGEGKYRLSA